MEKKETKDQMISYIRSHNEFYEFVDFCGHSDDQIIEIYSQTLLLMNNSK